MFKYAAQMLLQEVENYKNLELLARQVVQGFMSGLHRSPLHGFSVEFAEHRQYNRGEGIRHIDWKLFAKTEKLYVKKYEEETNLRCRILLDNSSSMYFPENSNAKIKFSVLAAASIMQILKRQRDAFGLSLFADSILFESGLRSSGLHYSEMLQTLQPYWDTIKPGISKQKTALAKALEFQAQTLKRRSLLILFTDMFDNAGESDLEEVWNALKHLKFNQHEILIFNLRYAPQETFLEFENKLHKFVDLETGEHLIVNPINIKESYIESMQKFDEKIREKCLQYKIDLYQADVSKDFAQVLTPFYVRRMRMA